MSDRAPPAAAKRLFYRLTQTIETRSVLDGVINHEWHTAKSLTHDGSRNLHPGLADIPPVDAPTRRAPASSAQRPPGSVSPSPQSPRRTRPPASTRRATPPEAAPAAPHLTSELRRVLAALPAMLASRDGNRRPACVGWASLAPSSTRERARSPQVAGALAIPERSSRIGRFPRESGSKQAGAAVVSGRCVRATRTPPATLRRT